MKNDLQVWSSAKYGGNEYDYVVQFAMKKKLDDEIILEIDNIIKNDEIIEPKILELCCGRAPISQHFSKKGIVCTAIDNSLDMFKQENTKIGFINADITSLNGGLQFNECMPLHNIAVIENGFYALTLISEDHRPTKLEADFLQKTAIKNIASMMSVGAKIIISDPLASARKLSVPNIIQFVISEFLASAEGTKNAFRLLLSTLRRLSDPRFKAVLERNRQITNLSYLRESHAEVSQLFEEDGYFKVEVSDKGRYLGGHNTWIIAERSEKVLINNHITINEIIEFDKVYLISSKSKSLNVRIGEFRSKAYKDSCIYPKLPVCDEYDFAEGASFVVTGKNTIQPLGTLGLHTYNFNTPSKLEMGSLLHQGDYDEGDFEISLMERVQARRPYGKIGELRRLATNVALSSNLGARKWYEFQYLVFSNLFSEIYDYCCQENIEYLFFLTTPIMAKLINKIVSNKDVQFLNLPDFKLDRTKPENQTLFLLGSNYFFGDISTILTPQERQMFDCVKAILEKSEDNSWRSAINKEIHKNNNSSYIKVCEKILDRGTDDVNVWYLKVPKQLV